uniref:Iodothyronine deiodinase n=1 Tax=Echeneis naucrates TaxID=173247 RepID=A0A665UZJ7_ECHNA
MDIRTKSSHVLLSKLCITGQSIQRSRDSICRSVLQQNSLVSLGSISSSLFHTWEQEDDAIDPPLCISDSNRLFSLESLKAVWHGHKLDFLKAAHLGHGAPNTEVFQLTDQRRSRILDYAKDKRPLILNFGSCT